MGSQYRLKCESYGYLTESLTESGSGWSVYRCRHCKSIVNAKHRIFRLDIGACPICSRHIKPRDWIYDLSWTNHCPRCENGTLAGIFEMHFQEVYCVDLALPV